uniref:CCDC81 HU domain-containing protein n=1 Tax=Strigamia maritima TaxID=126957 RepID=T1J390_STRMM
MRTLKVCGGTHVDLTLLRNYPILQLNLKTVVKEDVALFWNAVCTVIEDHLKANKGIILSGIGTFSYISKQRQIGRESIHCTKEPIFIISDQLAVANWLRRPPVYFDEIVQSRHLNFFLLSNFLNTDNCKLRECYKAIQAKLQHFISIRRPFVLPFPGVGKLVFRGTDYWKMKDFVGRSMQVANQIKDSIFRRSVDDNIFIEKKCQCTPERVKQNPGKFQTDPFVISYPKPCLGNCMEKHEHICPKGQNPSAIFREEFYLPKFKRKCIHQEDLDICPSKRRVQDDTMVDRLKADRLNAGDDQLNDDSANFGPNTRQAVNDATWKFRSQRVQKKYSEDDKVEKRINQHRYKENARNVKEREEMLLQRRKDAREYDLANMEMLMQRQELRRSENDFNVITNNNFKRDDAKEKKLIREKIVTQKKLLDSMAPRQEILADVSGDYFELPQEKLDTFRQCCNVRKCQTAKQNWEKCVDRRLDYEQERAIARRIEARLNTELNAREAMNIEGKKRKNKS